MQRTLRVYWLTEAFYPPVVGGQELFVAQLAHGLAARGIEVSVITRLPQADTPPMELIGAVNVRRIPPVGILKGKGWRALVPLLKYLTRLLSLLFVERRKFDVLIVSGVKVMPLIVVPLCFIVRRACILRVESFFELQEPVSAESLRDMQGLPGRMLATVVDRMRMFLLRRAGCVIAISAQIETALLRRGVSADRIRRIPNAVDLEKFKPVSTQDKDDLRRALSFPVGRTLVIYFGRFSRAKGLPMFVEAWPELIARHPDLYLLMVGSGKLSFDDCENYLKQFVRTNGLEECVRFCGESDRVYQFLQAADLFIFPTEYEGFSLALVEALGSGIPSAVTSVGAAPDLIRHGENGFLFPPKDKQALLDVIDSALEQRDRWPQIGRAARESVRGFNLAAVVDSYHELCVELTSE